MRKALIFTLLFFLLSFVNISEAVSYPVWSANFSGNETNTTYSNETVYVQSVTIGPGSGTVRVYVVNDSNSWVNQTSLSGVIDYTVVNLDNLGHIPLTSLWNPSLIIGSYDIVVDMNQNGIYDAGDCGNSPWPDCVDDSNATGFQVIQGTGTATAGKGGNDVGNHNWYYNVSASPYNVMSQIKINNSQIENITVNSFALQAFGTGNDTNIVRVDLVVDANSNGLYENNTEIILANSSYSADNGNLNLAISGGYNIGKGQSVYFLIVYEMSNLSAVGDTFQFNVTNILATGVSSGNSISIIGLPIVSGVKTTVSPPTTTTTTLQPTTTTTSSNVTTTTVKPTTTTTTIPITTTVPPTTTTTPKKQPSNIWLPVTVILVTVVVAFSIYWFYKTRSGFKYSYNRRFPW